MIGLPVSCTVSIKQNMNACFLNILNLHSKSKWNVAFVCTFSILNSWYILRVPWYHNLERVSKLKPFVGEILWVLLTDRCFVGIFFWWSCLLYFQLRCNCNNVMILLTLIEYIVSLVFKIPFHEEIRLLFLCTYLSILYKWKLLGPESDCSTP